MRHFVFAILLLTCSLTAFTQRRVTPVGTPVGISSGRERTDSMTNVVSRVDLNGNTILVDTVTGQEYNDSTLLPPPPRMIYPLMHSVIAGVNLWDGAMRLLGQKYGVGSVWAALSLHNRYMPYFEVGLSSADDTPDGSNFTYKSPLAPFFKIGANYNFLYNSTPDYQIYAGLRYGFTPFKYSIDNVTVDEGYWNDPSHFSIATQSATAGYLEFVLGIKVKIVKQFSVGWHVGFHKILHESAAPYGKPMVIPGYGKRGATLTAGLSIIYTIPLNNSAPPVVDSSDTELSKSN
ncbi:MAG: DUF6048 family protein [Lachnoclostridium sp.]|nr:DUF6048 family protein [Lachnoclostridium sp.]